MQKLNVAAMAIALGAVWGGSIMLLGWVAPFGWGTPIVELLNSVYIGYSGGWLGGILGGIMGFIDGAIGGALLAFIYNKLGPKL